MHTLFIHKHSLKRPIPIPIPVITVSPTILTQSLSHNNPTPGDVDSQNQVLLTIRGANHVVQTFLSKRTQRG